MKLYRNENVLGDNIGYINLISVMGSDLQIVNDARVSYDVRQKYLEPKDIKLIKYLIQHKHTSPLRGCVLKFEVKCPLYIARQWWKHHVASNYTDGQDGWNEQSLRYTEGTELYVPGILREQSRTNKQVGNTKHKNSGDFIVKYRVAVNHALIVYQDLLDQGICREQARGILPTCIYTKFRWTTSLHSLLNFISLRNKSDAQWEIQQYAKAVEEATKQSFPVSMKFFLENT